MKTIVLSILLFLPMIGFSQGQILSFSTLPASPTTNDQVKVLVHLSFSSGGCDVDNKGSSTTGSTTTAYSLHCIGMLTVICPITDTFDLGTLPAGTHTFNFTLSSGSGGPGCSPGIVPDDSDTYTFNVTQALSVEDPTNNSLVSLFPNPMAETAMVKVDASLLKENTQLQILDATGRIIYSQSIHQTENYLSGLTLEGGIYFYQITEGEDILAIEKMVVE